MLRSGLIAVWFVWASTGMAQERIPVVTTTSDLRSLVEAVGGDRVAATSLVPANFDAEDYQEKPQDVVRVKSARMVVRVGLDYDLWFDRVLAQTARPEIQRGGAGYVDASYAIAVLEVRGMTVGPGDGHAHGSGNPHYWLDPKNAEIITGNILETLARLDPPNSAVDEGKSRRLFGAARRQAQRVGKKLARVRAVPMVAYQKACPILRGVSGSNSSGSSRSSRGCRRLLLILPVSSLP